MTKIFNYKTSAFVAGVVMVLFSGAVFGSEAPQFDLDADVRLLTECFKDKHGEPDKMGQYKLESRRYVNFDVTDRHGDVHKSLLPLGSDLSLGQRVFHGRTYEVVGATGLGASVLDGLQAEGVKLFVRSSPLKFDPEYWALYELLVPVVPEVVDREDKAFDLPDGRTINLSDLPSLYDEVGEGGFTQYFFGIYYRELKE